MSTVKVPKRLKIKEHCNIDGVREGKRLKEGIYVVGRNLSEAERDVLIGSQFHHAVEILDDVPPAEKLAEDAELPQPEPSYTYLKHREIEQAQKRIDESRGRKR